MTHSNVTQTTHRYEFAGAEEPVPTAWALSAYIRKGRRDRARRARLLPPPEGDPLPPLGPRTANRTFLFADSKARSKG